MVSISNALRRMANKIIENRGGKREKSAEKGEGHKGSEGTGGVTR